MSRQMAFQLTYPQILEKWVVMVTAPNPGEGKKVGEWIDSITQDEKEKAKLLAAYSAMHNCIKAGRNPKDILKVIAWRGKDGKPDQVQTEFKRNIF